MITRDLEGQIRFHSVEDEGEVTSALKEIFNSTDVGRDYKTNYYTKQTGDDDYGKLIKAAIQIAGSEMVSINDLTRALILLIDSGEIRRKNFTQAAQLDEPEEDRRPRDRNGKLLTDAQIAWGEMARFAETASVDAIRQRKHVDGKFREFVATNLRREMDRPVGDSVAPAGQPTTKARLTQELIDFARKYSKEPIANLRPKAGFVTLEGQQISWATFNNLLNEATAAGAIL
jgi:hypothetical protein